MIPQRIKLRGFLCYQDEQEISFDGSSLWMLAGLNGSGKSTVFDAVTYALFGHHRGGSQHAIELINKNCDRLSVEFEFTLDGREYLIRRTLQRSARGSAKATQQISHRQHANGDGQGSWAAIEGTHQKKEFDDWVAQNIGLNYETFTSSVLLLQGRAEKLLDSTAKGRFEVLAGIVDLDRYARLHRRADDLRKGYETRVKELEHQLDGLPEVTEAQLAEVEAKIALAEEAQRQAEAEVERLRELESRAREWADLQARLTQARHRWELARRTIGDAAAIERDVRRLQELKEALPRMQAIFDEKTRVRDSDARTKKLEDERQKQAAELALCENGLDKSRQLLSAVQASIAAEDQRRLEISGALRQLIGQLGKLEEYERYEGQLARLREELERLPGDPALELARAREHHEELSGLAQAAPLLARLHGQREALRQAEEREITTARNLDTIEKRGRELTTRIEQIQPKVERAEQDRQRAESQAAAARALLQQARQHLQELGQLDGEKVCRRCGQPLTAGHLEAELRRRSHEVAEKEKGCEAATQALENARRQHEQVSAQLARAEEDRRVAREEFMTCRAERNQAQVDAERLRGDCHQTYRDLAEPFRSRVSPMPPANWLAMSYPREADVLSARQSAAALPAVRDQVREAEQRHAAWNEKRVQEATVRQNLTRLQQELPAEPQAVRREHVRLTEEERTLDRRLSAHRKEAQEAQEELDQAGRAREKLKRGLADLEGRLHTEEVTRQHFQAHLARALKELPPAWLSQAERIGLKDLHSWAAERDDLVGKKTEDRGRDLEQARRNVSTLEQDKKELEARQEQFPPEARQEIGLIQAQLQQARAVLPFRARELSQASQERALLEDRRQRRQQLRDECLAAEGELAHYKLLSELLGRERLQLHLVRQAERQVVDQANAVLDRLSGGQLYLRLCGEAGGEGVSSKALELEAYNRSTGERPINVAFLSGSQKFRVAVSLALGIGQYASRQHRPIESVIIDEGFGCLDHESRPAMIQELQNLRSQLRCILLVSHQEEFAEAFADGYRFELADGATRVTRFQR
jgi:exonuclease SbcC